MFAGVPAAPQPFSPWRWSTPTWAWNRSVDDRSPTGHAPAHLEALVPARANHAVVARLAGEPTRIRRASRSRIATASALPTHAVQRTRAKPPLDRARP